MNSQNFYSDKVVLVTGGAGAIGSNLSKALVKAGAARVVILDNLSSSFTWNIPDEREVLFIRGDITNESDLKRAFRERPDVIFHAAASFANQRSVDYPLADAETNISGIIKLLEYTALLQTRPQFIYLNTEGGSYGGDTELPCRESEQTSNLGSPYYISKHAAELYCNFYYRHYEIPITTLRLFNSYGPGEVPGEYRNVIPNFVYWAMHGQPLPITGTGRMTRDFTYVGDLVQGILKAGSCQEAIGQSINLCSGVETEMKDVAEVINRLTGNSAGIQVKTSRKWDQRPRIVGDNTLAKTLFGFETTVSVEEGLRQTILWFRKHWDKIEKDKQFNPGMSAAVENYAMRDKLQIGELADERAFHLS